MIARKIARAAMLVGLSGLLSMSTFASSSFAGIVKVSSVKSAEPSEESLRQGLPGRRLSGGTRGEQIFAVDAYLAALTTPDNLSITVAEHPTLLFYIPEMVADQTGELVLRDAQDNRVYEKTVQLDSQGGIVSVDTAKDQSMPALSLNETYRWYFSIIPESTDRASDVVVHGNIRRVEQAAWLAEQSISSTEIARLSEENPLMQARMFYQQAQLWHDAAVIIGELRQANPTDEVIAAEWQQLIETAGLTAAVEVLEPTVQIGLN